MSESAGQAELFAVASGFLMRLNEIERAAPFLAAYDMRCEFDVLDGEPFHAVIADGRVAAVARRRVPDFSNRDDFALFGRFPARLRRRDHARGGDVHRACDPARRACKALPGRGDLHAAPPRPAASVPYGVKAQNSSRQLNVGS